ncbi:MAG: response regulator transcription factor [Bacteroidia bacterium]|nr:response regulator transcription factor [Bacteroidia bacterium]
MKILIIEDEKLTAKDLMNTIKLVEPNAEIVAQIATVEDAIFYFENQPNIDLIFSDIQLGDGSSFEIFEKLKINTPIIFCTAFNEYALKAFETSGIDYILKPFSKNTVQKAILKFKTITQKTDSIQPNYKELFDTISKKIQSTKLSNIIVYQGDKIIPLAGDTIALFYIDNGIVKAINFDNKKFTISYNLEELEQKYSPHFFRPNRQFLVNRSAIKEAAQYFNRKHLVHLTIPFSEQILVGKEKINAFLDWLANY